MILETILVLEMRQQMYATGRYETKGLYTVGNSRTVQHDPSAKEAIV